MRYITINLLIVNGGIYRTNNVVNDIKINKTATYVLH